MQSLCTLRNHCRQWPRNTRYQADATPYLGRTSTGWIAPALPGALTLSPRRRGQQERLGDGQAEHLGGREVDHQLELGRLCTGKSAGFVPLNILSDIMLGTPTKESA